MDDNTDAQRCATALSVGEGLIAQAEITGAPITDPAALAKITNHDLMVMVFGRGTGPNRPMVAGFEGNPNDRKHADWGAHAWWPNDIPLDAPDWNLYLTLATYAPVEDGRYVRREKHSRELYGFLSDDLKSWIDLPLLPAWAIETSPGNYQAVFLMDNPLKDDELRGAQKVANAMAARGFTDPGAMAPTTRYMRLPVAVNGKFNPPFRCKLVYLNPAARYSLGEFVSGMGLELKPLPAYEAPRPLEALAGEMGEVQRLVRVIDVQRMDRSEWAGVFMHALRGAAQADPENGLALAIEASWHHSRDEIEETIRVWKTMDVTDLRSGIDELRRLAGKRADDPTQVFANLDEQEAPPARQNEGAKGVVAEAVEIAQQRASFKLTDAPVYELPVIDVDSKYVVKGLIYQTEIGLIYGPSGAAKTFFSVDMAVHIATGREWFGKRVGQKVGVVLVANEDPRGVGTRLHAALREKGIDAKDVPIIRTGPAADMMADPEGVSKRIQQAIARLKREWGVEHIVVLWDTLMASWRKADDNSPEDMGTVIANCTSLRDAGITTILIHHSGKDKTRGPRGHSSLFAAVDSAFELEYDEVEGVYCATVAKRRSGVIGERLLFSLRSLTMGMDSEGDAVEVAVVKTFEQGKRDSRAEKAARLPDSVKEVFSALVDAVARFGSPFDAEVAGMRQAVTPQQWRDCYAQMLPCDTDKDRERLRQSFSRGRKRLVEEGHVGYFNGHNWVN